MSVVTTSWYVSADGSTWTLCSTAGICRPVLTLRANGTDEFTWQMPGDFLADPAYAYGSTIYLARGVTTEGTTVYTCRFVGRITSIPRQGSDSAEVLTYTASGAWWWLEQIVYQQHWAHVDSNGTPTTPYVPFVVLGQNASGSRIDGGAQIADVIDYAAAVGAPLVKGTVDTLCTTPYSEHTTLRCADAIRQILRFQPDTVCWFDYDNRVAGIPVPKLHCRRPANLTTVQIATLQTDADSISMTPRYDLQTPGVRIAYEQPYTVDGTTYRNVFLDDAGTVNDARTTFLVFDLSGTQITNLKQDVVVADYPEDTTDKTFWRSLQPWLEEIQDADLAIQNVTRDGELDLDSYLVDGSITQWMLDSCGVHMEEETWEADISYIRRVGSTAEEKVVSKHVSVVLRSTDASTRTYTTLASLTAGEPKPSGLATALYASWSRLHWDGSFRLIEQEASFQCSPGNLVNLTGGRAEWAFMAALVQTITVDLEDGATQVRTGTCGRLEADSLLALWRAAHFWRFSWQRPMRTSAEMASSGSTISGPKHAPVMRASAADPGQAQIKRFSGTDGDNHAQEVVISPASITFASAGDKAAQSVQLREVRLLEKQVDGSYKAKKAQVLCSTVYDAAGGDSIGSVIGAEHSVELEVNGKVHLVGDTASPGNNKVYATNGSGTRGWIDTVLLSAP